MQEILAFTALGFAVAFIIKKFFLKKKKKKGSKSCGTDDDCGCH
ncbi:FeoB-associated Cys-rich membrane protein [Flavobacterium algicola]|nr:FeoB-associated Cys-rich membrane protein [Flavobacterium algicola]MCG9791822.1 FeoB-associated Cys-rich membrane protein [Flavobacterium algicola]